MNKSIYEAVARQINARLSKAYDDGDFKPRVSVFDTSQHGKYYDKWSLMLDDNLYELANNYRGIAQDMFYADETYVVGDFDLYLEPITKQFFGLAVL